MSWKSTFPTTGPARQGIEGYADERIGELTAVCVDPASSDQAIRQAQAGIAEMRNLKAVPGRLEASAQIKQGTRRREY